MRKALVLMMFLMVGPVQAMSVHDPINAFINLLNKMENQISKAQQQVTNHELMVQTKRQLETIQTLRLQFLTMQQNVASLTGSSDYGRYLEGPFKALDPRYTPKTLNDLLWLMRDVGQSNGAASDQLSAFLKENPYYKGSYTPSYENDIVESDRQGIRDNSAATAVYSQETYEAAQQSYSKLTSLQKKIDKAGTLKNAVDLNNRLIAELGYMFAASMRNDSVSNRLQAKQAQQDVNAETRERDFNRYRPIKYQVIK